MESKVTQLHSGAKSLAAEFQRGGARSFIDQAIILDRAALVLCPSVSEMRIISLSQLAIHLSARYSQFGAVTDINEAIVISREALSFCLPEYPIRSQVLSDLAARLSTRYERLGETGDLEAAIVLGRDALALRPPGSPGRWISLNNLALDLCTRYQRLGGMDGIDEAIVLGRGALALCVPGHEDRSMPLNNLVKFLSARYLQIKGMDDLDEAIVLGRQALAICPPGHPDHSLFMNNLSASLFTRYEQLWRIDDINEAIDIGQDALALRPLGHPDRSMTLNNIALYLSARYRQFGSIQDIHKVIGLDKEALMLRPPGHPGRSISLTNLAFRLSMRFQKLGTMEDIDEAIALGRDALALCPPGQPHRSESLRHLADHLYSRFMQSGQQQDKDDLFSLYTQMENISQVASSADLSTARAWIRMAEEFQHPTTLLAYETSFRLLALHLASLPPLPQHLDILKNLTSSLQVNAFSAYLRNHSPAKAVELLEQGRGVFWSQLTRLRSPLDDVIASGPEGVTLADRFTQLTSLIRDVLNCPGVDQHNRVCHLNVELHKLVATIRDLPGLSHFLLPSLFSDLQQASREGPVIIVNASEYSCDALIVLLDQDPVHIPLQITRKRVRELTSDLHNFIARAKSMDMTKYIAVVLREIWDEVVSPIVDFLQTIHPSQSRIWWCPTAEFSLFPLHATGPFKNGEKKLADFYVSSYTPTLTSLIRARRHEPLDSAGQVKCFVGIGQANAAGADELIAVAAELAIIGQRVDGLATFTCIEGPDSSIARVVQELSNNQWAHLACHGFPNQTQPFKSAFALYDGHFTIEHITRCELRGAQFAYLSACHTTVGDADSHDEVIHLASAMQFAGFRSVIGTMWEVNDDQAKKITSRFYQHMTDGPGGLDHTRAAHALHKTMKELKGISFDQRILYVHLGA